MIMEDFAEQTRNWMNDLDNFGLPPPPKTLFSIDETTEGLVHDDYRNSLSTNNNNNYVVAGQPKTTMQQDFNINDASDPIFLDKVRKFQTTQMHPYASAVHVETTKIIIQSRSAKLATDGGIAAAQFITKNDQNATKISSDTIAALTEEVRKINRPLNQWAEPKPTIKVTDQSSSNNAAKSDIKPKNDQQRSTTDSVSNGGSRIYDKSTTYSASLAVPSGQQQQRSPTSATNSLKHAPNRQQHRSGNSADGGIFHAKPFYPIQSPPHLDKVSSSHHHEDADKTNNQHHLSVVATHNGGGSSSSMPSSSSSLFSSASSSSMHHQQLPMVIQPTIATSTSSATSLASSSSTTTTAKATRGASTVNKSSTSVVSSSSLEALETQQRMFERLRDEVEQQLIDRDQQHIVGTCKECKRAVTDASEATRALGQLFHNRCFTCSLCGRALRGKRFYEIAGRIYCEEDYLYCGFQESAERCALCNHLIVDMVLQAVGKSFHPQCFRCHQCRQCLDGVPFALDATGNAYCIDDYHRLFAPRCAACQLPILPASESGETVRVVAINRDYHIECYVCEGCGLQLTDEPSKRCFPLAAHLLCQQCHVHWVRAGGSTDQPITDL